MKIKNQFYLLGLSIISLPILCCGYFFIENYNKSQDRVLIKGYKEIRKLDGTVVSKREWNKLYSTIRKLPDNVDSAIISDESIVLISTMDSIPEEKLISKTDLWDIIENSSSEYFYQFTKMNVNNNNYMMISRIPRRTRNLQMHNPIFIPLIGFLVFIVIIITTYIILIFLSISRSITALTNKTKELAEGNLNEKITPSGITYTNEITSITESLEKMRLALLEAQKQKNKFIMGISHDLRTPVAIIKGYTEALSDGFITSPDEVKNTLDLISTKTTQLEDMINTLINYVKLNTTDLRNLLKEESITNFIIEFVKDTMVSGQVFTREIISNVNFTQEIMVKFDKQLVYRAFENLFTNAVRYTRENDKIIISAYNDKYNLYFSIEDTGYGISEEDLTNIFNLFYRGTNSRREEGMGIGLSVVQNIIDTHEWKIDVKSELNKGSKFTVTIPYNKEPVENETLQLKLFKK